MKLLRFIVGKEVHIGTVTPAGVVDLTAAGLECSMERLLAEWESLRWQISEILEDGSLPRLAEDTLTFANVTSPQKIVCVGLNYGKHAAETKGEPPQYPLLFSKYNDALAAHGETVPLPQAAEKFDYEAELVIVMGQPAWQVSEEDAADKIFGYTCGNDLSARDAQFVSGQWLIGKTFPKFAPAGPYIVPKEEIAAEQGAISCRVNGNLVQSSNTADMIFKPATIVSYASHYTPLSPGDLIFTGTPEGVILGKPKGSRKWLQAGDQIAVEIEGIGTLKNRLA